jgi:hypothetical protein
MKIDFSNTVSVASLYLALVGLLSTFFFVHLGNWLGEILGTEAKWRQIQGREPKMQYFDKTLECYYQAVQSSSIWTFLGWLAVTLFLSVLGLFLETLRRHLPPQEADVLFYYVSIPCYVFLALYTLLSIVMLSVGYWKARRVRTDSRGSL